MSSQLRPATIAGWCNGSTQGFEPWGEGSIPSLAAKRPKNMGGKETASQTGWGEVVVHEQ